jgi:CubicO group peptidase (beta-lactamase class C family)
VSEPGGGFSYSDVGFNVLELIVEEVTGESFVGYMDRAVLAPLGMEDSSYAWRPEYAAGLAAGHEMDGTPVPPYVYPASAAGGLFVTVDDVARFVAAGMLTAPGAGGAAQGSGSHVREVLTADAIRRMYQPRAEIPGLYGQVADAYGLGHFIERLPDGRTAIWHGGQGHGWMTHFHSVPRSGDGIVVLTNSQRSWPFLASVLPLWAHWSGIGDVRFSVIIPATRVFWGVVAAVALAAIWQAYRLVVGVVRGSRRPALVSAGRPLSRGVQLLGGTGLIALVVWRISLPYVDEASIFPAAAPWAAVALIAMGVVLVASAAIPRRGIY